MKYETKAERAGVKVTKSLEVTPSGTGRIGYRVSATGTAPVSVIVGDYIPALTTVQLPVSAPGHWTLSGSTLEWQRSIAPDQPTTTGVRFNTDAPESVADRQQPQLFVDGPPSTADRPAADASDETGGFEFPLATDGDSRATDRTQQPSDPDATASPGPSPDGGQAAPRRHPENAADGLTASPRLDRESEFSMPDDEYTEAELIAPGTARSTDE